MPRRTHAASTRPQPSPWHAQAEYLTQKLGRTPRRVLDTLPGPDTPAGAYALAGVPAVESVPCLEERAPGLLVVRFRPVGALGFGT